MPIAKLSKEQNPQIILATNNRLDYKDKKGEISRMKPTTALTNVIKEAGVVAGMKHSKVLLTVEKNGEYKKYFVNRLDNKTIVLNEANDPQNKKSTVYINYVTKDGSKPFYAINTQNAAGKSFVESVGLKDHKGKSYISTRVTLVNDDMKKDLLQKGKNFQAIIFKDGYKIDKNFSKQKSFPKKEIIKQGIER